MVWNFPGLSLGLSLPRPGSLVTRFQIAEEVNNWEELHKLNEFINRLEDEVIKIKAFKRELPLSFLLLTDAIGKLKEEARKRGERGQEGKLDEIAEVNSGNDKFEKKTWITSAQLWSPRDENEDNDQNRKWQLCKNRGDGGAFQSFTNSPGLSPREEDPSPPAGPALSLQTPGPVPVEPGPRSDETDRVLPRSVHYTTVCPTGQPQNKFPIQTGKKRRRCWSPELHRRFVEALDKLGGSQVATPKQIRELMQIDGLTNDEVKSHLQKYRLHIRKLPACSGTNTPSSLNDIAMGQGRLKLGRSQMDLLHSSSLEDPLHSERSGKCNSTSIEDQHNDNEGNNDDNSEGHSWNI